MPSIKLSGDPQAHVIDLSAPLHLPEGDTMIKSLPLGTVPLLAGQQVALRMNPKTGRVFELWRVNAK